MTKRTVAKFAAGALLATSGVVAGLAAPASAADTGWNGTRVSSNVDTGWNGTKVKTSKHKRAAKKDSDTGWNGTRTSQDSDTGWNGT
ncbi:MAG: hypothetical protein WBQ50_16095 [Nocardioides sp.]